VRRFRCGSILCAGFYLQQLFPASKSSAVAAENHCWCSRLSRRRRHCQNRRKRSAREAKGTMMPRRLAWTSLKMAVCAKLRVGYRMFAAPNSFSAQLLDFGIGRGGANVQMSGHPSLSMSKQAAIPAEYCVCLPMPRRKWPSRKLPATETRGPAARRVAREICFATRDFRRELVIPRRRRRNTPCRPGACRRAQRQPCVNGDVGEGLPLLDF